MAFSLLIWLLLILLTSMLYLCFFIFVAIIFATKMKNSGFLFISLFLLSVSLDFPFHTFLSNSFILFFIFLTFFPAFLLLSSATINFQILWNLCHIIASMPYFFNQVLTTLFLWSSWWQKLINFILF